MADFIWVYHQVSTKYPESGFTVSFGNSYDYAEGATSPDQRIFTLNFNTLRYFTNPDGSVNASINPPLNMKALEDFYNSHQRWKTFSYNHPVHGLLNVRFNAPLEVPKGVIDGGGWLESITVTLKEQP